MVVFGCATNDSKDIQKLSRISIDADAGCEREPSVQIYELRRGERRNIEAVAPLQVKPGTYSIGVSCLWVRSRRDDRCKNVRDDEGARIVPYKLELRAGMNYTFSCTEQASGKSFVMAGSPVGVSANAGETAESFDVDNRDFAATVPKPLEVTLEYDLRLKVTRR